MSISHHPLLTLASFLAGLKPVDLPADVREMAKRCITDAVACAFAGRDLPWAAAARDLVAEQGGYPEATVWASGFRGPACEAAFANAVMAHSIIQEDTHGASGTHPGTMVVPSALAVGEKLGSSGARVLLAVTAGYDAIGRLGTALHTAEFIRRGYRPSGIFGPFGAAAAAGVLLGLNEGQMLNALALAGNCGAGLRQWAHEGTHDIFYHNGFAARNGVSAALLALRGITGATRTLDGPVGMAHAYAGSSEQLSLATRDLGTDWEIRRVFFKPTPACQAVQSVTQVTIALARAHEIDPDRVRRVVVYTSVHGKVNPGNDYPGPFQMLGQAQMSNQFAVAVALLFRRATYEEYRRFDDTRIADLARRVFVEAVEEIDATYPAKRAARVQIEVDDGRVYTGAQEDTAYPTPADLREKLRVVGGRMLPAHRLEAILEGIERIEEMPSIVPLARQLAAESG